MTTSRGRQRPPRLAAWLIATLAPRGEGESAAGDLDEEFERFVLDELGSRGARRWYWRQVLFSLPGAFARRLLGTEVARAARRTGNRHERGLFMDGLLRDLRHSLRSLRARPGFASATILTLALGIGVNAAIYALVSGVVLRDLPFTDPARLVRIAPDELLPFAKTDVLAIEEAVSGFAEVAAWGRALYLLTDGDEPEEVRGGRVFANHFSMLGAEPLYGRWFLPEDGDVGAEPVVVLSHGLWSRRFGGDVALIGRKIEIDGRSATVVGVMGPRHQPMESDWQIWSPMTRDPERDQQRGMALNARLAPGVTIEAAAEQVLAAAERHWAQAGHQPTPDDYAALRVTPLRTWILRGVDRPLVLLLAAVGVVFLLTCANVASILAVHGRARDRELALRLALGAKTGRLVRLLLVESAALAFLGGVVGLGLAWVVVRVGRAALPADIPRTQNVAIDLRVLGFGIALAALATLLVGIAPALRASSRRLAARVRGVGFSRPRGPLGGGYVLVSAEIALALILLVAAGLMLRSFVALSTTDPGFQPDRVVVVRPSPPSDRYDEPARLAYYDRVLTAVRALPEVRSAGAIQFLPMTPGGWWSRFETPERPTGEGESPPRASVRVVTDGYFQAMGIPLLAGRAFDASDMVPPPEEGAPPPSILVNQALANAAWPGEEAVGRGLLIAGAEEPLEVVGVVGDVRQQDPATPPSPEAYLPLSRVGWSRMWVAARFDGNPSSAVTAVRTAVQSIDPQIALSGAGTLSDVVGAKVAEPRFYASALLGFGVAALLLGAIGVYGVMSYAVSLERRPIGVHLALGAPRGEILRGVLRRGLLPVIVGLAVGGSSALALAGWLEGALFAVSPRDPLVLLTVPLLLIAAALVALWLPARRASKLDPLEVLRSE